jgi:biopolymer transport protein ExbB/TolQ
VVAYNRYAHDIERLAVRFESFMEEFSNILQRQAPRHREPAETRQETGVKP